jgi:hypothetical protein
MYRSKLTPAQSLATQMHMTEYGTMPATTMQSVLATTMIRYHLSEATEAVRKNRAKMLILQEQRRRMEVVKTLRGTAKTLKGGL